MLGHTQAGSSINLLSRPSTLEPEDPLTDTQYPAYNAYKALVGQFTPMDTVLKYIWTTVRGTRAGLQAQLQPVSKPRRTE